MKQAMLELELDGQRTGSVTVEELRSAGWDMREDPTDGRLYGRIDTRGAGWALVTPPNGKDGEPDRHAPFGQWVHPGWLVPGEFETLPNAPARAP